MTIENPKDIAERLSALEAKLETRTKRAFPTATVLAILPICFGLYQFHLSNEFKKEDNQTRALLAALEGETPSAICGNLSLLVEGGLVTEDRLAATEGLIAEITKQDGQQFDGGIGNFDCLPRIATEAASSSGSGSGSSSTPVTPGQRRAAPTACFYDQVEVKLSGRHDRKASTDITDYLEDNEIAFAVAMVDATEWQINNYSGMIWYYSIESRSCAKSLSDGLAQLGVNLELRYYTRSDIPSDLPIGIWPSL